MTRSDQNTLLLVLAPSRDSGQEARPRLRAGDLESDSLAQNFRLCHLLVFNLDEGWEPGTSGGQQDSVEEPG